MMGWSVGGSTNVNVKWSMNNERCRWTLPNAVAIEQLHFHCASTSCVVHGPFDTDMGFSQGPTRAIGQRAISSAIGSDQWKSENTESSFGWWVGASVRFHKCECQMVHEQRTM